MESKLGVSLKVVEKITNDAVAQDNKTVLDQLKPKIYNNSPIPKPHPSVKLCQAVGASKKSTLSVSALPGKMLCNF